ncbi:hypothetical protein QFC22_006197 [Naganishia vaughanmartiniae]|uniref:Uncharacterized protein n=1 Tax=Naganishia vaughanmartiniae TaxID=1424756 RepID=A0ACC2WNF1_9TREE|nr:hypothetical protein QFC22_006197 [Naganishia vaughanmartiniae]
MGVKGLWEVLQPAAEAVPLTQLSLDALKENKDGSRALRIGIDASLWVFHAKSVPQSGLNPFIRTLFFKILKLLQYPVLLLFVFDGPYKPAMKRGNKVGGRFGRGDRESQQFKLLLDEMGLEYWDAPGEAEAELACINQQGLIDAVLTDDVDALVFGATCVLRNPSRTLSGNASNLSSSLPVAESREDYQVYRREVIENADLRKDKTGDEDFMALDVDGMIFLALLVGGDYHPAGMPSCGPKIAMGLIQAGLGTNLLQAYRTLPLQAFQTHLQSFIESLREELATNAHGFLPGKRKALASKIPADFPSLQVLEYYAKPRVSEPHDAWPGFARRGAGTGGAGMRGGRGDPRAWARACERFFEWGSKEEVGKRFRTLVWRGEIVQAVREKLGVTFGPIQEKQPYAAASTTSPPLPQTRAKTITSYFTSTESAARTRSAMSDRYREAFPAPRLKAIHNKRVHIVTGHTAEYRIEYDPSEWNRLIQDSMDGTRLHSAELTAEQRQSLDMVSGQGGGSTTSEADSSSAVSDEERAEPKKTKQRKEVDLDSSDKVWIPVELVKLAFPELEEKYEQSLRDKEKASRTPRKRRAKDSSQAKVLPKSPAKSPRKQVHDGKGGKSAPSSSQQSTVTSWFDSNKPASSPLSTPRKRGATARAPVIEIIDLSDSPDAEPTVARKPASTGSSVIIVGSSSPIRCSKGKNPLSSRSLPRYEEASTTSTDTSDDEVSTSARTPGWLRRVTRPRPEENTQRTPRARTSKALAKVVDTSPPRADDGAKDPRQDVDEREELEECELTPTAVPRGTRATRRASTSSVQIIDADEVALESEKSTLIIPPTIVSNAKSAPSITSTRPSMMRPGPTRTRAKPVLAGPPSSSNTMKATPPPPPLGRATSSVSTSSEKDTGRGTLMDFFKPSPKAGHVKRVKLAVYRLVEETDEAEYYMPDYL